MKRNSFNILGHKSCLRVLSYINISLIKKIFKNFIVEFGNKNIDLIFVSIKDISIINYKSRQYKTPATVLTFNYTIVSEIYICVQYIKKKHSIKNNQDLEQTVLSYVIHSMCNCYHEYFEKNKIDKNFIYFRTIKEFDIHYKE